MPRACAASPNRDPGIHRDKAAGESPPFSFSNRISCDHLTRLIPYRPTSDHFAPNVPTACPNRDNDPSRQRRHCVVWLGCGQQFLLKRFFKKFKNSIFQRCPVTLEIHVRSRRKKRQSAEADRRDDTASRENAADQAKPVTGSDNDNDKAWPLIPFPDGWFGS
jgi:hypothetical protein